MTIDEGYHHLVTVLKSLYPLREAKKISEMVIERLTQFTPTQRIIYKNDPFTSQQEETWKKIKKALLAYIPVQQVLEEAWFYGHPFYVNSSVLIPRPETEELVEWILEDIKKIKDHLKILDIGTGSGCIPITLKIERPDLSIFALEKFADALSVAQKNAINLNTDIHFIQHDILEDTFPETIPNFDIIVSNPPYIPQKERKEMDKHVIDYEPKAALFVPNDDALLFYKKILETADKKLKSGGKVFVEINEELGQETKALFEQKLEEVILKKDFSGKDRLLSGRKS